jgi:large subunit ribosomal protein L10
MPTERKIAAVESLKEKMSRMQFVVIADYRGLTVAEIGQMRARLYEHGAEMIVAKNTLLRIAARETGHEMMEPLLQGPTAITFAYDDVGKVAKALNDYLKTTSKVTVRGGLLGRSVLSADSLAQVAKMPTREEAMAQVLGGINGPIAGLMGVLDAPVSGVVGIISAVTGDVAGVLQARIDQLQSEGASA